MLHCRGTNWCGPCVVSIFLFWDLIEGASKYYMDTCILCLGREDLIPNILCGCKYYKHEACWVKYIQTLPVKCPLCREEVFRVITIPVGGYTAQTQLPREEIIAATVTATPAPTATRLLTCATIFFVVTALLGLFIFLFTK
jgi:hypothetical protein